MSIQHIPARGRMVDANGIVTPEWLAWFRLLQAESDAASAAAGSATEIATAASSSSSSSGGSSGGGSALSPSGVAAGIYGDEDNVPQITVDEYGRITHAINVAISGGGGGATPHDFLSSTHPDTVPADPIPGAIVVAEDGGVPDLSPYWFNGLPYDYLPTPRGNGEQKYWFNGLPAAGLTSTSGTVKWTRKLKGAAGYVLTSSSTGVDWQPSAAGGNIGAEVYCSPDFTAYDRTPAAVVFTHAVVDDASFWAALQPTRLTIPTSQGGYYAIVGQAAVDATAGGVLAVSIYVNGAKRTGQDGGLTVGPSNSMRRNVAAIVKLNAADYVELYVELRMDVLGYTQTIKGGSNQTLLQMAKV